MSRIILITGAMGFVGRQILQSISKKDTLIRIIVREGKNIPNEFLGIVDKTIETKDLFAESVKWWEDTLKGVDTIIHAAWYVEPGKYLYSPKNIDCLIGTLNLARGASKASVRRFVGIGTCFEYDLTCDVLTTETVLNPITPYAGAKVAAYYALSQYFVSTNIEIAWCRLFYLYGEGEDSRRLVPYLRQKLEAGDPAKLSHGNQIRDMLDVKEAGKMIAAVALGDTHGAVNICSGIPITIRQFVEKIADQYKRRDLLMFGAREEDPIAPKCVVGVKTKL